MDREYARPLDVAALARTALMSTAHFSRQFRAAYGETPYAYLMTRPAVHAAAPANRLAFPLDQRFVVAGWKLLFLRRGTYQPDGTQTAEWNRGAYLVEGLAHCGACHTPRNALGAERVSASFAGGDVDNWHAYAINARSPSPVPWNTEALFAYLRQGWHPDHGVARGPMAEVVSNLSSVDEKDVHAIAVYMTSVFGPPTPDHIRRGDEVLAQIKSPTVPPGQAETAGAAIYAAACATCHETGRPLPYGGVNLGLSTAISGPDPRMRSISFWRAFARWRENAARSCRVSPTP